MIKLLSLIVFEFFSGIGGMRDALSKIPSITLQSVHAFDINPNANLTYQYNFNDKPYERTIESFTLKEYEDIIEKEKNKLPRGDYEKICSSPGGQFG